MAQATDLPTTSRFHNLSNAALADALGHADASLKGAEAECKALKEIKQRGLLEAAGDSFAIRVSEQISGRSMSRPSAMPRQFLAALRDRHGLDRRLHLGREAARRSGLSASDWLSLGSRPSREPSSSPALKEPRYEQTKNSPNRVHGHPASVAGRKRRPMTR
jgi:hypothetical protein